MSWGEAAQVHVPSGGLPRCSKNRQLRPPAASTVSQGANSRGWRAPRPARYWTSNLAAGLTSGALLKWMSNSAADQRGPRGGRSLGPARGVDEWIGRAHAGGGECDAGAGGEDMEGPGAVCWHAARPWIAGSGLEAAFAQRLHQLQSERLGHRLLHGPQGIEQGFGVFRRSGAQGSDFRAAEHQFRLAQPVARAMYFQINADGRITCTDQYGGLTTAMTQAIAVTLGNALAQHRPADKPL